MLQLEISVFIEVLEENWIIPMDDDNHSSVHYLMQRKCNLRGSRCRLRISAHYLRIESVRN